MSKTLPSQFISFIITSHRITNTGAMLTLSSEMIQHHHDLRHSRQKVPSTHLTLTSPPSPSSASVSSHSSSLQVLTVFLSMMKMIAVDQWLILSKINNSCSVIDYVSLSSFQRVGWLRGGSTLRSIEIENYSNAIRTSNVFGDIIYNETVIYFETQCSTPRLGTYQTNTSCSSHQQVFVK